MELNSKFTTGDAVYCVVGDRVERLTVGLVRVEIVDSAGIPDHSLFDNYKPRQSRMEEYMCVETGIGSGNIYRLGERIFATAEEAESRLQSLREEHPEWFRAQSKPAP